MSLAITATRERVKAVKSEAEDKLFGAKTGWEIAQYTQIIREANDMLKELKTL